MPEASWSGERHYLILSLPFTVRWNSSALWDVISPVIDQFRVEGVAEAIGTNRTTTYSLIEVDPPESLHYRVLFGDELVTGSDIPGPVLDVFLWHLNKEVANRTLDYLLVHAGAVVTPNGECVLLPAPSGSGKSTLVAGLVRSGFGYLSDEAGAVEPITKLVYPYPKTVALRLELVRELFPDLVPAGGWLGLKQHVHSKRLRPEAFAVPSPVRYVIFPRYEEGSSLSIAPMSRGSAAMELGRNSINLSAFGERALPLLSELALGAASHRIVYGSLREGVRAVWQLTGMDSNLPDQVENTASSFDAKSP